VVLAVLLGVLAATIVEFNKVDPFAAQLLLPYLGWTTFATALTYWIGLHNTRVSCRDVCYVWLILCHGHRPVFHKWDLEMQKGCLHNSSDLASRTVSREPPAAEFPVSHLPCLQLTWCWCSCLHCLSH